MDVNNHYIRTTSRVICFIYWLSLRFLLKLCCQELELKKQAEFEAQAKEMELKKAEEGAADPVLREVRERLNKLEEKVKDIVIESKKQLDDAQIEASKIQRGLEADKSSEVTTRTSTEGKTSEPVPSTPSPGSQHKSHG